MYCDMLYKTTVIFVGKYSLQEFANAVAVKTFILMFRIKRQTNALKTQFLRSTVSNFF